jgi:hypothetical protein
MKSLLETGVLLLGLCLFSEFASAYGSGGSAKACEKPQFSKFQPPPDTSVQTFSEFSFTASPHTSPASIEVSISAGGIKYAFKSKDLQISTQQAGSIHVVGRLSKPLREGFARLNVTAASNSGCSVTEGYLIKLSANKPGTP